MDIYKIHRTDTKIVQINYKNEKVKEHSVNIEWLIFFSQSSDIQLEYMRVCLYKKKQTSFVIL